jgi:Domain of unknown function (DUF362)/Secretion system C-terminal sorting domain
MGKITKNGFHKEKKWFTRMHQNSNKLILISIGLLSTLWFLLRVIPKPSRASYPCMHLAAPFAATFTSYILALLSSVVLFKQSIKHFSSTRHLWGSLFLIAFLFTSVSWLIPPGNISSAQNFVRSDHPANEPIGEAVGIFPGRVAWVWAPEATNENCQNIEGDYWWQAENTNQTIVDEMLSKGLFSITQQNNDSLSWDALFKSFNEKHGNGNFAYQAGEKIFIKLNICSGGWGSVDEDTYEKIAYIGMEDTSPQIIISFLKQLIDVYGIAQEDIYLGDPIRIFFDHYWEMVHSLYPNVHYIDWLGKLGREKTTPSPEPVIFYSDGNNADSLPTAITESKYMINISCLKQHNSAGVTFCAKNHFGSLCREMAAHMHPALPSPTPGGFENLGMGKYRNLVDLMMHKDLGEKTILFVIDGLWGSELPTSDPIKWQSEPFNNDWPSSLFLSQDPVAIESVGTDFVMAEFEEFSHMDGTDDYLHQAADSSWWPENFIYDPENDGTIITSLGVHEHWNNNIDKQYTRNLGTGDGIELYRYNIFTALPEKEILSGNTAKVYPNPFFNMVSFEVDLKSPSTVNIKIFNQDGGTIEKIESNEPGTGLHKIVWDGQNLPAGNYFYQINIEDTKNQQQFSGKLIKLNP